MTSKMKNELQVMRSELMALERAFEIENENGMFLALAGMQQANAHFGRELKRKVDRRVKKEIA